MRAGPWVFSDLHQLFCWHKLRKKVRTRYNPKLPGFISVPLACPDPSQNPPPQEPTTTTTYSSLCPVLSPQLAYLHCKMATGGTVCSSVTNSSAALDWIRLQISVFISLLFTLAHIFLISILVYVAKVLWKEGLIWTHKGSNHMQGSKAHLCNLADWGKNDWGKHLRCTKIDWWVLWNKKQRVLTGC